MSGTVELDADGQHLLIRFPYREDLVEEVRGLPGRRWDSRQKTWRVPASSVELVYATFARHLFEFAPEVSGLLAGTFGGSATTQSAAPTPDSDSPPADADAPAALSISALNEQVRDAMRGRFPETVWITGEIIDLDKQIDRQHKFFTLIEKAPRAARPKARVEAALFERTAKQLLARLLTQAPDFALRDGIEIRAKVRVDLYPATGRYQVIIEDIDPTFTLGKLALQKEETLRELRQRGLHERNRALALPVPALRIGVLASPDSDGWNDFLRHLEESGTGFDVTLVPVKVQGTELKPTMLAGLQWFATHARDFDVLCVLRGGGSRTDLAWFDDLEVALAVAQHPLKVLVGIGHQRDQSVLDVIAHSLKTPTAVAEFLCELAAEERRAVRDRAGRLLDAVEDRLGAARALLTESAAALRHATILQLRGQRQRLRLCARDLARGTVRVLGQGRGLLLTAARDLHGGAVLRIERGHSRLRAQAERGRRATERRLERATARLDQQTARQRLLDPRRVLQRGFALVRDTGGKVLPSVATIRADQPLVVQMRDGSVHTHAESIHPAP